MNATAPALDHRERERESDAGSRVPVSSRIMSIDALRGFVMFWIIGMEEIFAALSKFLHRDIENTLDCARSAGFHFSDSMFRLCVFIIGGTLVFWLGKSVATDGKMGATLKIVRRAVVL